MCHMRRRIHVSYEDEGHLGLRQSDGHGPHYHVQVHHLTKILKSQCSSTCTN
jgi:hypothetical protein